MSPKAYHLLYDHVLVHTDAEQAHHAAFRAIQLARPLTRQIFAPKTRRPGRTSRVMGIDFQGRLGLAAGFDKNGDGIDALAALGFGFIEIGTITGEPQPGNPKPRLMRLAKDRAVVNRMGFNNDGAEVVARRLAQRELLTGRRAEGVNFRRVGVPVGINIGKTKVVDEDDAGAVIADYEKSTGLLAPYADYLVVNVSSPNTPGLRNLQTVDRLEPLLRAVRKRADSVTERHLPLLVKIAPDLADEDVNEVADLAKAIDLDGIVATNTTISREGLVSDGAAVNGAGPGGLSGAPLKARSLEVLRQLRWRVGPEMTLIGVGGITTAQDARERLDAGADLLQGYTAFIYEGPLWPSRINRQLGKTKGS